MMCGLSELIGCHMFKTKQKVNQRFNANQRRAKLTTLNFAGQILVVLLTGEELHMQNDFSI